VFKPRHEWPKKFRFLRLYRDPPQSRAGGETPAVREDLLAALDAEPRAKAFFATIDAANRYAVLWRIQTAVKAETRARRIAQLVAGLARGETIHIFKPKA